MNHASRPRTPAQLGSPDHRSRLNNARAVPGASDRLERAVLAGILLPGTKSDPRDPLGELAALAKSANVEVVDSLIQKRLRMSAVTGIGKGKLEELAARALAAEADVVIFDNELAPRQIRNLEVVLKCKVIDRSELILDIFAARARSKEAQLQVELAQLEYTAPRLRGMWTHLERIAGGGGGTGAGIGGGVGTRGPGERQIEIDRRIVRARISHLKREIEEIDDRKRREVLSRKDFFSISLVGYTNSGKSTLMNRLTNADQFAADMLFATLDTKTVRWKLADGQSALLSDTVGFVRDLPHKLVASFRATLEETIHADLLLHVVDVSAPWGWQQMESVESVLAELACQNIPTILVLNKIDLIQDPTIPALFAVRHPGCMSVSAKSGQGVAELVSAVSDRAKGDRTDVTVRIAHSEGKLLSTLVMQADVLDRRYVTEGVEIDLRLSKSMLAQLLSRNPSMVLLAGSAPTATMKL